MRFLWNPDNRLIVLLVSLCLALALSFTLIGSQVVQGELRAWDVRLRDWVMAHQDPTVRLLFSGITHLGAKELLLPAGLLFGWRFFRGSKGWVVIVVFCALASAEFVALLKRIYQMPRPAGGIERSMGLSFPSGHSSGAAALLIFLGYVTVRNRVRARIVVPVVATIIFLVGLSRIYLDMHWLSDVLGGWVVGGAFGIGCCVLFELIQREHARRKRRSEPSDTAIPRQAAS